MVSLINKQLLLTAYAYLFTMEQQKAQQGSEALQLQSTSQDDHQQTYLNTGKWSDFRIHSPDLQEKDRHHSIFHKYCMKEFSRDHLKVVFEHLGATKTDQDLSRIIADPSGKKQASAEQGANLKRQQQQPQQQPFTTKGGKKLKANSEPNKRRKNALDCEAETKQLKDAMTGAKKSQSAHSPLRAHSPLHSTGSVAWLRDILPDAEDLMRVRLEGTSKRGEQHTLRIIPVRLVGPSNPYFSEIETNAETSGGDFYFVETTGWEKKIISSIGKITGPWTQ